MPLRPSLHSRTCRTDYLSICRKKSCDGRHPTCTNCERLQIQCSGYEIKVIWEDDAIREGMRNRGPRTAKRLSHRNHRLKMGDKGAASSGELIVDNIAQDTTCVNEDIQMSDCQAKHGASHGGKVLAGLSTASGAFSSTAHESNTRNYNTTASISHLSPYVLSLTPIQSIFLDNYINNFSLTYPTYAASNNPFLSTLIPLALRNETVLHAVLALSGIQVENSHHLGTEVEVLRLRGRVIKGCRHLLEKIGPTDWSNYLTRNSIGAIDSSKGDLNPITRGQDQMAVDDEDDLALIASVLLMILYDKLSGASCNDVRHHLVFAHFLFEKRIRQNEPGAFAEGACSRYTTKNKEDTRKILRRMSSHYKFLYNVFLYNDLLAGIASNLPTLSEYDLAISAIALGDNPGYSTWHEEQSSIVAQIKRRYYFPTLLSIINNRHAEVSMADIDAWDRQMSWLPSFSNINYGVTRLPSNSRRLNTSHHTRSQGSASPRDSGSFEDYVISEIYTNAAKILYVQRLRESSSTELPVIKSICDPQEVEFDHNIGDFTSAFVSQLRQLPENSIYENALLWPIGVVAKEVTDPSDVDYVLWRLNKLEQKFKLKLFRKFTERIASYWGRDGDSIFARSNIGSFLNRHRPPVDNIIHEAIILG